jgi:mannose-P-dolichol utilization defect 1
MRLVYSMVLLCGLSCNCLAFNTLFSRRNIVHRHREMKAAAIQGKMSFLNSSVLDTSVDAPKVHLKDVVANAIGYSMGFGSVLLYSPIIVKMLMTKSSEGMSIQTWICSVIGMAASFIYPYKKGFPLSTYMDSGIIMLQCIGILGLICLYGGRTTEFLAGLLVTAIIAAGVYKVEIPERPLQSVQVLAIMANTYSLIPQIILNFQTKRATYSAITAFLSGCGCIIRVLTTLQLTRDPLVLTGYVFGAINNLTVLFQIWLYQYR